MINKTSFSTVLQQSVKIVQNCNLGRLLKTHFLQFRVIQK